MAEFVPVTADEWPTTEELGRMLQTALHYGAFSARRQLLFCAAVRRLANESQPTEYLPIIAELEEFADRSDLPILEGGKVFFNHSVNWELAGETRDQTAIAKRHHEIVRKCIEIHSQHLAARGISWQEYHEGDPGFEQDEASYSAVMGHVNGTLEADERGYKAQSAPQAPDILRDVVGNPLQPVVFDQHWRTDTAVSLARTMYESREFSAMPILADALQDAGCDNEELLAHCRKPGSHFRGCWVCDLVLGKS